ncbi:secreted protein [Leifsonia xyli subsp. xyli str. CTCB07]|uniref:Secreted protein n=1 Tax=Leifsonia xyli subsp. xyli (strain CTCB07) TaxID=281090 RepID=Q6AGJ0_LEIXX|nr:DUF4350 domain-containing protein [Leifsonia xyli]AAT88505.1 secreted protein [Leifsonia xyli subsp. xyli str. CTCB07]
MRAAGTLEEVREAADADSTILVFDSGGSLTGEAYAELSSLAGTIVVVEPGFEALRTLAPGVHAAGEPTGPVSAGCPVPAARNAGRIDPRATGNTKDASLPGTFSANADVRRCFVRDGGGSLVQTRVEGHTVSLLGSAAILMNDGVDREGNAALALNLLGGHRTLVWCPPGIADRPVTGPPDLAELTPGWVTPAVLLLLAVFAAAAIWRGRRFGPLVVESLPIVVRAGETREGRARLYQRSSARLRAADALRIGAIGRLARAVGLPRTCTAGEIADAVAAVTRSDRSGVRGILLDDIPTTDAQLLALSDTLAELERATAAAVTPGQAGPTGRMEQ